ncbi:MAG: ketopantoate reductase family protein [Anaerolineales bacterium]|nr:ketopantoate reductase family protein [Anaerolineales bacterium]
MKILMFGAGVINTLYGYALAEAGNDVTHYVRPGKKKMLEGGINLKFLDGRASPPKQATAQYGAKIVESLSSDDRYELVIVSVRHYQLDSVLPVLKDKIGNADILIFNGNWDGFGNLDQFFPRSQYLLGFPVAGGGYSGTTLDGALLDEIRLGELDGKSTPRLEHVANVFRDADIKVDVQSDMQRWLWVHFAINSGIIGAAFKAGSAQKLLNSIPLLRTGILAGREALEVCRARGVNVDSFEDAKSFYLPVWIAAAGVWYMMKSNLPARKIMETHTAVDELQAIYRDVLKSGEALGVPMPHFKSLKPYVDNPPVLHGA